MKKLIASLILVSVITVTSISYAQLTVAQRWQQVRPTVVNIFGTDAERAVKALETAASNTLTAQQRGALLAAFMGELLPGYNDAADAEDPDAESFTKTKAYWEEKLNRTVTYTFNQDGTVTAVFSAPAGE